MYKDYISWIDLLLVPLYFVLLYLLMLVIRHRRRDHPLYRKYLVKGFVVKICCTIFYCCIIYFYYGIGDSINYFKNVLFLKQQIAEGNESFAVLFKEAGYMKETYQVTGTSTDGGWLVEKIALILSYFSFNRFVTTSMLFATLAYAGMFRMFETFSSMMPGWDKRLAWVVLYFPSLSVYGSGILKDTVCISALGWLLYSSYQLFLKKEFSLRYIWILVFCIVLIYLVKVYIIAAFMVPYILFLLMRLIRRVKSRYFRRIIMPVLLALLAAGYWVYSKEIDQLLGSYAIEKLFESVKEQQQSYIMAGDAESGSVYDLGSFEPTLSGFISMMPAGINASLFRPFIWETRNPLMLFTALESLVILLMTLYVIWKAGLIAFLKKIFNDPIVFLCIVYALLFAAIVGISTLNFGTLARYRIPIIPFYLAGLLIILYQSKQANRKKLRESTE